MDFQEVHSAEAAMAEQGQKPKTIMRGPTDPFAGDMTEMINARDMSDVKFQVGKNRDGVIYGHKAIISPRCKVLKAKFALASEGGSAAVDLPDTARESFLAVLEFIYTNCVTLTDALHAIDVLGLSITYKLEELRKLCNKFLVKNMTITTASDIMQAAVTLHQRDLQKVALSFIEDNTKEVFADHTFHNLKEAAMCEVLRSDKLDIDEMDIIETIGEWAEIYVVTHAKTKAEIAKAVVDHIRLPLLEPEELKAVHEASRKDRLIAEDLFANAYQILLFKKSDQPDCLLTVPRSGTKERAHHKDFLANRR